MNIEYLFININSNTNDYKPHIGEDYPIYPLD